MNERPEMREIEIQELAASFTYPSTPDVASKVRRQLEVAPDRRPLISNRLAWVIVLILIFVIGLWSVPQVRAAVQRIFNIGAITIFELEDGDQMVFDTAEISATKPSLKPLVPEEIAFEVSLTDAGELLAEKPLYLPAYPQSLAEPDHIFWVDPQYQMTPTVISIWEAEGLALYQIGVAQFASKGASIVEETAVHGQRAVWVKGPHPFWSVNAQTRQWQYVADNVLVWWHEDGLTFRLEGAASLAEAVRIAESLEKMEE